MFVSILLKGNVNVCVSWQSTTKSIALMILKFGTYRYSYDVNVKSIFLIVHFNDGLTQGFVDSAKINIFLLA